MTTILDPKDIAMRLKTQFGEGITPAGDYLEVSQALLSRVAEYLKNTPGLDFDFFDMITAADYIDRFELIYRLQSIKNNTLVSLKVKCSKEKPAVPSLSNLWHGAHNQEREVYDLFGIEFTGHPDLKRIVLWDGFEGYPLRKDFKEKTYGAGN
jgi:NADH-quinone oxidoreductase subunit C